MLCPGRGVFSSTQISFATYVISHVVMWECNKPNVCFFFFGGGRVMFQDPSLFVLLVCALFCPCLFSKGSRSCPPEVQPVSSNQCPPISVLQSVSSNVAANRRHSNTFHYMAANRRHFNYTSAPAPPGFPLLLKFLCSLLLGGGFVCCCH